MPLINPDTAYKQVPLREAKVPDGYNMPDDWLIQLGNRVAGILQLDDAAKTSLLENLNRHAGPESTYSLKTELHGSLKIIFAAVLENPVVLADAKSAIAAKLHEGAPNCTAGFHDRVNDLVLGLSIPENFDGLLGVIRRELVNKAAIQRTDEVHAHNRFFVIAQYVGYGVRHINPKDVYQGKMTDDTIRKKLADVFASDFTVINILNKLHEQLYSLVMTRGYNGRREAGYAYSDFSKFDNDFLTSFIQMTVDELFDTEDDEEGVPIVKDINWRNVNQAIYNNVWNNKYFIFSEDETCLLKAMLNESVSFDDVPASAISLFQHTLPDGTKILPANALADTLTFFNYLPVSKKAGLINYYLKFNAPVEHNKAMAILDSLEKVPGLHEVLQYDGGLNCQFLAKAVHEDNLDKVKTLVSYGADINPHLGVLVGKHKSAFMHWLARDTTLQAKINESGLKAIVTQGIYEDKSVAEAIVHSGKGRQVLLADERLRSQCPATLAGKTLNEWMLQAEEEKKAMPNGMFVPLNPLVKQFLQHVIYGEQVQAEQMLNDHAKELELLLTTKAKVKDYSGRKIYGTALQLALGAEDVKYHDDEECMVEMIHKYLKKLPNGEAIIADQTTMQFPEGWELREEQRAIRDLAVLHAVIDTIINSHNPVDWEKSIHTLKTHLEFENKSKLIQAGKHFNHQLLVEAIELYRNNYSKFSSNSAKSKVLWAEVIGTIQRYVPATTAQALCTGIGRIVDDKGKLERTMFAPRSSKKLRYFPLDNFHVSILGKDFAYYGHKSINCLVSGLPKPEFSAALQNYLEKKKLNLHNLCSAHGPGQTLS